MRKIFWIALCFCFVTSLTAQAQIFRQYPYNYTIINPAYTGYKTEYEQETNHTCIAMGSMIYMDGKNFFDKQLLLGGVLLHYAYTTPSMHSSFGFTAEGVTTDWGYSIYKDRKYSLLYAYTLNLGEKSTLRLGTNLFYGRNTSVFNFPNSGPNDQLTNGQERTSYVSGGLGVLYKYNHLFIQGAADYLTNPRISSEGYSTSSTRTYQVGIGYEDWQIGKHFSSTHAVIFYPIGQNFLWNSQLEWNRMFLLGLAMTANPNQPKPYFYLNAGIRLKDRYQFTTSIASLNNPHNPYMTTFDAMLKVQF